MRNIMLCSSRHPLLAAELVIAEEPGREEEVRARVTIQEKQGSVDNRGSNVRFKQSKVHR